jgi:hypothetical protein
MIENLIVRVVFIHMRIIELSSLVIDGYMQIATWFIFAVVSLASIVQTVFVVNRARADGFPIYSHAIVIWGNTSIPTIKEALAQSRVRRKEMKYGRRLKGPAAGRQPLLLCVTCFLRDLYS